MLNIAKASILRFSPWLIKRCSSYYKPGERKTVAEALTKVSERDVTLFRYEDPKKVMFFNLFGMLMFPMWTYLGVFSWQLKNKLAPYKRDDDQDHWAFKNVLKSCRLIGVAFFGFGVGMAFYSIFRTKNTVRRLVLKKGGQYVTIVTYGLTGMRSKYLTVPIHYCSAVHTTFQGKYKLFIKVRRKRFSYRCNVEDGIFHNRPLFDRTVGIKRML